MFSLFKKRSTEKLPLQLIGVKSNKKDFSYYKGKFVSIEVNDNVEGYYFTVYDRSKGTYIRITNKVDKKYFDICSKYDYGLIYDYDGENYTIAVICKKGFLKVYDIELLQNFNNGESFIIEENNLINNNKVVGKIKNDLKEKVSMNCLEDNKLICFISK